MTKRSFSIADAKFRGTHFSKNLILILISLFFLPASTFILFVSYAYSIVTSQNGERRRRRRSTRFYPKTILVTGVGMAKGLRIARAFYAAGHNVIGADFEPDGVPVNGRFSKALDRFYRLNKPDQEHGAAVYISELVDVVKREKVDLWVSCSGVASAIEDGQAMEVLKKKTDCKCIQFDVMTTATLHEKDTFIEYTEKLDLPIPETHQVTSRDAVHNIIHRSQGKKSYIMKPIGMDDVSRDSILTILPRRTQSLTYSHVSALAINKTQPWVVQQYINGKEYCTHAIVVNGVVKLFVACPSAELLMHYEALPDDSSLSQSMLSFTQNFASRSGPDFTGHLSFDFLVQETASERGVEQRILPIECNPRAHTAVVLFEGQNASDEMVEAYLSVLQQANEISHKLTNGGSPEEEAEYVGRPRNNTPGFYWVGHDLIALVFHPLLRLFMFEISPVQFGKGCQTFLQHIILWREGTYEIWDPLPWWWLYHIYWPGIFLNSLLRGKRWSRVNVSTTKAFAC